MFLLVGLVCGLSIKGAFQRGLTALNKKVFELRVLASNPSQLLLSDDDDDEEFDSSDYERIKEEKTEVVIETKQTEDEENENNKEITETQPETNESIVEDPETVEPVNETETSEIELNEEPLHAIEPVVELIESDVETVSMAPFVKAGRRFLKAFRTLGIPKQGRKWQVKGNKANFTVTFDACSVRGVSVVSSHSKQFHVDGIEGKIVNNTFHFSKPQTLDRLKLVIESVEGAEKTCLRHCEVLC